MVSVASNPATVACDMSEYRPYDQALNVSVARGVYGVIKTPAQGEVLGFLDQGYTSAADIALGTASGDPSDIGDFVQLGWYLGGNDDLDYVNTPHMFVGEWYPGATNNEILRQGSPLQWNTYYTFSIWRHDVPNSSYDDFYFYMNGTFRTSTIQLHNPYNYPRFVGEANWACTDIAGKAWNGSQAYSTLQYLVDKPDGTVQWYYFWDDRNADPPFYITVGPGSDRATADAYGPCC
jgi:hypothetical protein